MNVPDEVELDGAVYSPPVELKVGIGPVPEDGAVPNGLSVLGTDPVPRGAVPDRVDDLLNVPDRLIGLLVNVSVLVEELGAGPPDASVLVAPAVPFGPPEPTAFVKPLAPPEFTVLSIGVSDPEGPPEAAKLET